MKIHNNLRTFSLALGYDLQKQLFLPNSTFSPVKSATKSASPFYSQPLRISSALISGVLLVSGCSGAQKDADGTTTTEHGAGDSQAGTLYQFDKVHVEGPGEQTPFSTIETPVTVQPSDDLKGAAPPKAEFSVDRYTVSAKAIRERLCRVDIEIEYAPWG